jgi:hypothetical protein
MTVVPQDEQRHDARYYFQVANKAYQEKDYAALVDNMKLALALRPTHETYMYYLAAGYSLTGRKAEALALLSQAANMGFVYNLEGKADFEAIGGTDEFRSILSKIESNKAPVINSEVAATVAEKDLIPEGIAYDPVKQAFFLGSVYKQKIVMVDQKGETSDFSSPQDGLWSALGMKVDPIRRLLWVSTTAQPQMRNYKEEDNGKSEIFKYDVTSGRLLKKYLLPNTPERHWLGDLAVNSRGDVFATDSVSPAIYVIDHHKDELELFTKGPPFANAQGLAFTPDEKHLLMTDYSLGVFLIDVKTREYRNLPAPPDTTLLGIDGLCAYRGSLIGVQNGINPNRIVRVFLNADSTKIEKLQVLEVNNPLFNEPTLGVVVGNSFYFTANSQWSAVDQKGQIQSTENLKGPIILKLRLR